MPRFIKVCLVFLKFSWVSPSFPETCPRFSLHTHSRHLILEPFLILFQLDVLACWNLDRCKTLTTITPSHSVPIGSYLGSFQFNRIRIQTINQIMWLLHPSSIKGIFPFYRNSISCCFLGLFQKTQHLFRFWREVLIQFLQYLPSSPFPNAFLSSKVFSIVSPDNFQKTLSSPGQFLYVYFVYSVRSYLFLLINPGITTIHYRSRH